MPTNDNDTSAASLPGEVADAAAVAALVFTSTALGRLLAFGTFFQLLSTIVFVVLAVRRRTRTVVMATSAALMLGAILGGIGPTSQIGAAGLFGGVIGSRSRRGWRRSSTIAFSALVCTPVVSAGTICYLLIFSRARELNFENALNLSAGAARVLSWMKLDVLGDAFVNMIEWSVEWWWAATPLIQAIISVAYAWFVLRIGEPVVDRVQSALGDPHDSRLGTPGEPLPIGLDDAKVRRGDAVVASVSMNIQPASLTILQGPNGAGKSTLLDALAGLGSATIDNEPHFEAVGLGRPSGVALVGQRPDAQVLALTVADELRWCGLDDRAASDWLERVGLDHLSDRGTSTLSGGELQRLAIAAALAKEPRLLLCDEATSMLDPASRANVMRLLRAVADGGTAVLATTHLDEDRELADAVVDIGQKSNATIIAPDARPPGHTVLEVRGVSVVHDVGSPWAVPALHDIDLTLRRGELTLITGGNGSGKTTLAWTLAGLHTPASGTVLLDGEPLEGPDLRIALAFQHARLQLLTDEVEDEVESMAGEDDVAYELRAVGLDPISVGDRKIDHLSGGEQRRVLLAGILARRPDVVLLDEPLAGLDDDGRDRLRSIIHHLLAQRTAVVVVSHEPDWADDLLTQRIELDGGRIVSKEALS
ncbi:MAG: DUF2232 domain-containing protein [Actinomycetia bacterium]|nr:DUF2232 domain-containing protein [Actinomycetes bacterium]